jgi:DNA-binding helix-hairpin-helix protein with protein kinase domain
MGRHPFAGVWLGSGDMPIERAIKESRFAYSTHAQTLSMRRPPGAVPLATYAPQVSDMFERAFRGLTRPAAAEWVQALGALAGSLKSCAATAAHPYPGALSTCPWCDMEASTGARLFGHRLTASTTGCIDLTSLLRAIEQVPSPPPPPSLPSQQRWRPPAGVQLPSHLPKIARTIIALSFGAGGLVGCSNFASDQGWLIGFAGLATAFAVWPRVPPAVKSAADAALKSAKSDWDNLAARWDREATNKGFDELRGQLRQAHAKLSDLANERTRRMAKLRSEQEAFQRRRFLNRYRIDRARIPGIGAGRAATLAGFGIETAYDVDRRINSIHGFGPKLTGELIAWRQRYEAQFRFNPNEPIDPGEIRRVEGELEAIRQAATTALRSGAANLQRLRTDTEAARERLQSRLKAAWDALKIAEARRSAL